MSADVETMFYVREKPWHGLGVKVDDAPNSYEALKLSGLSWDVVQQKLSLLGENTPIKNVYANVRSSDGKVLGIVTGRYRVVQNVDAFAFTDTLIGGDVHYETAGSLNGGRKIWLLARLPETTVVGDSVTPYLCFTNTHDGTGAVRACMTPVRVVCNNTLNLALSTASRAWSIRHTGDINKKIAEARETLELANRYMVGLDEYAQNMANITIDEAKLETILNTIFKVKEENTKRQCAVAEQQKEKFMICYFAPDIAKFRGTAWGALNAMTDMIAHMPPARESKNFAENNWGRIMAGHSLVDQMASMLRT